MQFLVQRASKEDAPEMIDVATIAFGEDDPVDLALFSPALREAPDDHKRWRIMTTQQDMEIPWKHFIKVVDTEDGNRIVGMAHWDVPSPSNPDNGKTEEQKNAEMEERMKNWPINFSRDAFRTMSMRISGIVNTALGAVAANDMWFLNVVAVDPSYQRRGIGRLLLDYGLNGAVRDGKDVYLMGTPTGMPLYLAKGMQSLGSIDLFGMPCHLMRLKHYSIAKALSVGPQ